jgi:3-ketosteroid 9alpha-monooxygenase subunit A
VLKGFPRGWFVIGLSSELGPKAMKSLHYFGRSLVLYRGEDDQKAHVLDALCPHLGADIGVGGQVVGDSVRCPFHAWRFAADGGCAEVPYAKKIPRNACLRAWPTEEVNGLIFMYHDPLGAAPTWKVPVMTEYGSAEWLPWTANLLQGVKTHPREIVENVADKAHFPIVHGTHVDEFDNEFTEHMAIQRTRGIAYPRGGGSDKFSLTATYYGPGYQVTEMQSFLPNRLFLAHTPIDETRLDLRFGVSLKIAGSAEKTAKYAQPYIENLITGFHEDIGIWEHKVYRDQPVLADGDGPIMKLRKWYSQFYETAPAA